MAFKKAVKTQAKLRCALFGPSGSGKTYTALSIASGMGKKIALVDSEHGSASKYADRFEFDTVDLERKTIEEYIEKISEAAVEGYDVLILDSLSHAWAELLEEIDKLGATKFKGNKFAAWAEGTPKQKALVEAILTFPGHIMATMRSKTEWQTENAEGGKMKPIRMGLAPEQGKGIEYEFDLLLEMSVEHLGSVLKDRTGKFQDKIIEKPGKAFGEELIAWLSEGVAAAPRPPARPTTTFNTVESKRIGDLSQQVKDALRANGYDTVGKVAAYFKAKDWDLEAVKFELGLIPAGITEAEVNEKFEEVKNKNIDELKKDIEEAASAKS